MEKLLIKNGTLHTMADEEKSSFIGDLLIEGKKIVKVGKNISSPDAKIINASGLHVLPGLIDAHSHMGVFDMVSSGARDEANEMSDSNTADMDVRYGIDTDLPDFEAAYNCGVTAALITEGSGNVINGSAVAVKTYGKNIFEMQMKYPAALKIALGGNPKRTHGVNGRPPLTRMGIAQILIEAMENAKKYMEDKENGKNPPYDAKKEAFIPVLKREIPLKVHCTQFDMLTAIDVAKRFNVKFTLDHAWGATDYINEITSSDAMICYGPLATFRGDGERRTVDTEAIKLLDDKGMLVCIVTDCPLYCIEALYNYIGEAVREGVNVERALRMVTINPAKIIGIEDRVGSLEVGKDADIAIFKGLLGKDTNAKIIYTISNGRIICDNSKNF